MRKIDTAAYNKRLHSEILELDKMLKQIKPEHINLFDADLIKSAQSYVQVVSDATWADNSNFNGIEMHKIKDMIQHSKMNVRNYYVERWCSGRFAIAPRAQKEVVFQRPVRSGFDGRKSFIVVNRLIEWKEGGVSHWSSIVPHSLTNADEESGGKVNIYKSASSINISSSFDCGAMDGQYIDVFLFFWR